MNGYRFVIQLQQKLLNSTVMKRYKSFHFNSRTSANGSSRVLHTRSSRYRGPTSSRTSAQRSATRWGHAFEKRKLLYTATSSSTCLCLTFSPLRRGQVSPSLSAVPSLLLRASLSCPPPCSSFPSFLPCFLSQQHTGRSAPGHVAAYSHCCLFFTSLPPRELLCLRKLSGRVQTPGLIQPGVFRRGQTLRRTSPIYLVFTARFVERPCNAEMLNYPRIVARLLKISPRGGDIAPRFFAQYSQEILWNW